MSIQIKKRISYLFFVLCSLFLNNILFAGIEPEKLSQAYSGEPYILLNHDVKLEIYFNDEGQLRAKQKIKQEYFALEDGVQALSRFLLQYNPEMEVKVNMARYYRVDKTGKKTLFHNVKTKFLKERDYYIDGYFYGDAKVKEIETDFILERWNYFLLDYEIIYTDLKFLRAIYTNPKGEHVKNFSFEVVADPKIEVEVVPFNFDENDLNTGNNKWTIEDIPSYKEGRNAPPVNYIIPHFVPVVRKVKGESFLNGPEDLFKWYNSLIKQLTFSSSTCTNVADQLGKGKSSNPEKIKAIFDYVKTNINYIAFEDGIAGFKPEESKEVLTSGYGDCKGVSNLLVDLLQNQGINSGHAWVGTRNLNYTYDLATLCVDNHMVTWVEENGELYILDATGRNFNWNKIPYHLQGKQALLKKSDEDFEIVTLPVRSYEENQVVLKGRVNVSKEDQDYIDGELKIQGNEATKLLSYFHSSGAEDQRNFASIIIGYYFDNQLDNVKTISFDTSLENEEVVLKFTADIRGAKIVASSQTYIYPNVGKTLVKFDNPKHPSYFDNETEYLIDLDYALPSGASSIELPSPLEMNNDSFELKRSYSKSGNVQNVQTRIRIKTLFQSREEKKQREEFKQIHDQIFYSPFQFKS